LELKKDSKGKKLTEDQIEEMSGGFKQLIPGSWSYGEIIVCPKCKNKAWDQFYCDADILAEVNKDLYTCAICGQQFTAASGYGITDVL
jgi:DNA-directed RNA polymerase subunit RPC12/RpoP